MSMFLDTHTFLWFIIGDKPLPTQARTMIENVVNKRFLSVVSLWEMAIKISIGKLETDISLEEIINEHITNNLIEIVPVRPADILTLSTLPFFHRDPFDRMIIAQTINNNIPIISIDAAFDAYSLQRLWD